MFKISTLYPDLDNKFPVEVDDFEKFLDPDISSLSAIQTYYQYYNNKDLISANAVLEANPLLKRMIVNAANLNKLRDAVISLQRYYLDDIRDYVTNIVKYKGDFQASVKYNKYDVVNYLQRDSYHIYMCINSDIPLGTIPTNETYWIPLTLKGEKGNDGINLVFKGQYDSGTQYYQNNCVEYKGSLYGALKDNRGQLPEIGGTNEYWALAWNFIIPNNYIQIEMLSTELQKYLQDIPLITDESNMLKYRWGIDNGMIFLETITE